MKISILDLGTNTFNIFIAEIFPDNTFKKLYKSKLSVKLGKGTIHKNYIGEKPFKKGIRALKHHKATSEEYKVEKIFAFATSAIRSASNGKEFVAKAKEKTGIDIQVISGDREAELIYYGVQSGVKMNDSFSLIVDIGGGSTEFIIANNKGILWKQSFMLGVSRLLEKIHPSDPITPEEIEQIENYTEEVFQPLFQVLESSLIKNVGGYYELIGSSGSFDSLAEMIGYRFYDKNIIKGITEYTFDLQDCKKMYNILIKSTYEKRLNMKGLTKMRVDMIVISTIIIDFLIKKLAIKYMRLSRYSLKEGVLWEMMHKAE